MTDTLLGNYFDCTSRFITTNEQSIAGLAGVRRPAARQRNSARRSLKRALRGLRKLPRFAQSRASA